MEETGLVMPNQLQKGRKWEKSLPSFAFSQVPGKKKKALRKNITKAFLIEEKKLAKKVLMLSKKK